jgi:hypothetical protein
MLIKRVYELDPLACPRCGGQMKVAAFIEPPQGAVIEKILRHCGLWNPSGPPRAPPSEEVRVDDPDALCDDEYCDQTQDSTYEGTDADIDPFLASF